MNRRMRRGFTLVELLVVIAIIGVLVALLVPAVNAAREIARKGQCSNNLRNLGQSMVQHETDKQYYPGRVNMVLSNAGVEIPASWMTKLLPYMERNNIWDTVLQQSITVPQWEGMVIPAITQPASAPPGAWYTTEIDLASCPCDPPVSEIGARLSYVINAGIWDRAFGEQGPVSPAAIMNWSDPQRSDIRANGLAHVLRYNTTTSRKVDSGYISKNDGTTATIMLSENVNAVSWPLLEEGLTSIVWTPQDQWLTDGANLMPGRQFGINEGHEQFLDDLLLQTRQSSPNTLVSIARPSSNHSGGVNVVFCDGHVEFLADDIHPWVYARRLSLSRTQARHPDIGLGPNDLVPAQVSPTDLNGTPLPTDF